MNGDAVDIALELARGLAPLAVLAWLWFCDLTDGRLLNSWRR